MQVLPRVVCAGRVGDLYGLAYYIGSEVFVEADENIAGCPIGNETDVLFVALHDLAPIRVNAGYVEWIGGLLRGRRHFRLDGFFLLFFLFLEALPVTALLFCVALPLFGAVVNQAANVIVPIMDDAAAVLIYIDEMLINHRPKEQLRVSVPARRICDVLR